MNNHSRLVQLPISILAVVLLLLVASEAQSANWSPPTKFFEVEPGGNVQFPTLLTDSGGNLHAFWGAAMTEGQPMALYHSRWQGDAWTEPVDVLLSPDGGGIWPFALHITRDDTIHVFWMGSGRIWYSLAHASQAHDARRWSRPDAIVPEQEPFTTLSVAQDTAGAWYLTYSNRTLDQISLLRSEDGVIAWLPERSIYAENDSNTWVGYPQVVVAPDGALWVSWQQMEAGSGRAKGIAYARSADSGETRSAPEQLIEGYYFGGFEVVGDVMVKKYGGGVGTGGRFVSFSYDSGATWTQSVNISDGGGEGAQGIGIALDSAGRWHFIEQSLSTFGIAVWSAGTWSGFQSILPAEELVACCPGENAVLGISEGMRQHVFWEGENRILWYTTRELDAPFAAAHALALPKTDAAPTVAPTPVVRLPTPSPTLPFLINGPAGETSANSWHPIIIGILPGAMLVAATVIVHLRRTRSP